MISIALVGENPSDTDAIANLLTQKYSKDKYKFFPLIRRITGSQLDDQKTRHALRLEYQYQKPDIVIFIRDLDAVEKSPDYKKKISERKSFFTKGSKIVKQRGVRLLNIYELEALILADIDAFNKHFGTSLAFTGDPAKQPEPKEFLKDASGGKFREIDNIKVFEMLRIDVVAENCSYFKDFLTKLDIKLKP